MRRTAIGLLVAAAVLLPASPCLACSCVPVTAAEAFDRAEVVFTGLAAEERRRVLGRGRGGPVRDRGGSRGAAARAELRCSARIRDRRAGSTSGRAPATPSMRSRSSGGLETNSLLGRASRRAWAGSRRGSTARGGCRPGGALPAAADSPLREPRFGRCTARSRPRGDGALAGTGGDRPPAAGGRWRLRCLLALFATAVLVVAMVIRASGRSGRPSKSPRGGGRDGECFRAERVGRIRERVGMAESKGKGLTDRAGTRGEGQGPQRGRGADRLEGCGDRREGREEGVRDRTVGGGGGRPDQRGQQAASKAASKGAEAASKAASSARKRLPN